MSGNCLGHVLCRNCLLKHVIEGKIEGRIEVMGRWGRKHKQLMNDIKEDRGYWKLRGNTRLRCLENLLWKRLWTCRKTTEWMNHTWFLCYICVCVCDNENLLHMYLILDAIHILHNDIQSVIIQMCLLCWTELTPFFTWVLELSVCLSEYPCGVCAHSTILLSSTP